MKLIILVLLVASNILCLDLLASAKQAKLLRKDSELAEALYLPNSESIRHLSFGYDNALADFIWFNTVNYFGKHQTTDSNYRWLYHMCDLATTLDPKADHIFKFGATMLAWEAKSPKQALKLLDKALLHSPNNWEYYYLRGFTYLYFLKDEVRAKADFIAGSKTPNAHPLLMRLAAKKLANQDDPKLAVEFLKDALRNASDPFVQKALIERLNQAQIALDIKLLKEALDYYQKKNGSRASSINDLIASKIIGQNPKDPFGNPYQINKETGEPYSAASEQALKNFIR